MKLRTAIGGIALRKLRLPKQKADFIPLDIGQIAGANNFGRGFGGRIVFNFGNQLLRADGLRIVGDDDGFPRRRDVVGEIEIVVGGIHVGGDRDLADAARVIGGQRDGMVFQIERGAGHFDCKLRAGAVDFELQRDGYFGFVGSYRAIDGGRLKARRRRP